MQGYFRNGGSFAHNNSILCASWGVNREIVWDDESKKKG